MAVPSYRDYLESIRGATDLVALVSEYTPLRKNGRRHSGLCPFHAEKTPSFSVDGEKQLFYCFGCQAGGDAFKFLMLYEKVEFGEAARLLGERAGIEPPARPDTPRRSERDGLFKVQQEAAVFFRRMLAHPQQGNRARKYLEKRGLGQATVEALGIGYAPDSWDALKNHLLAARFPASLLTRSGLFSIREDGGRSYDRFRDRLMFPILGGSGKVIGFGGRSLGEGEPKYLNSPETEIYSKGENLFGLHGSKDEIRRAGDAVLVEGYMDYAALHQAGIRNGVASLGTALTSGQVRLLSRYSNRVTVNYDPDAAGMSAVKRSLDALLTRGFSVRVLRLEGGLDPDAFIRERGADAYRASLESAVGYIDFLISDAIRDKDLTEPLAQVEALNELLPQVAKLENPAERSAYYGKVAERLGLEDAVVMEQLKKALRTGKGSIPATLSKPGEGRRVTEAEMRLVRSLLDSAEARELVLASLLPDETEDLASAAILRALKELHESGAEAGVQAVMARLPEGESQEMLTRIAFHPEGDEAGPDLAVACLAALRRDKLIARRRHVQKEMDRLVSGGAEIPDEMFRLKSDLSRRIDELS